MNETLPDPPELDPAALAGASFGRVRKGFEPSEVHAALGRAGDALRVWRLRDDQLLAHIDELEARLADAQRVDESHLTAVLGEETARIVAAARDAAAEIRSKAEEQAARLLRDSEEEARTAAEAMKGEAATLREEAARLRDDAVAEATRLRADAEAAATAREQDAAERSDQMLRDAEQVLAEHTARAEEAAAAITDAAEVATREAEEAAQRLRDDSREEADRLRADSVADAEDVRSRAAAEAETVVEAARAEGRSMVSEAKAVRERILRDLVDRRAAARRQIEGARVGRDRIVEMLRSSVDEVVATIDGLDAADAAAASAAVDAVAAMHADPDAEVTELLVELGGSDLSDEPATIAPSEPAAADDVEPEAELSVEAPVPAEDVEEPDDGAEAEDVEVPEDVEEPEDVEQPEDVEEAEDAEDVGDDQEPAGATVHDLFARIRAEGLDDEDDGSEADEGDGTVELADSDTGIDLTAVAALEGTGGEEVRVGNGSVATVETTRALLDRRDELLAPVEKGLSRALRRLASDEQNEMLDQLRRVKRGHPGLDTLLGRDADATLEQYVDALEGDFSRAAEAGSTFWSELAGTQTGALFDDDDARRERLTAGVRGFLDLHRAHLERLFEDAESEALEVGDLADRIRAAYRDWRSGSLSDAAGDLATAGFAHGERRAAGPGTPWRWVVDNGGLPCADGEDNALAGAVPCDEPFPTGDVTPPAHPGCRCLLVPARQ